MPLTPFHWSILVLGLVFFGSLYLPALAVSSVLMDLEPFYYMFIAPNPDGVLHGFFHTYIGASLVALMVGFFLIRFRKPADWLMGELNLKQSEISDSKIWFSSFLGAFSHIFLDSLMHFDLKPFWPVSSQNPFLELVSISDIYAATGIGLVFVLVLGVFRIFTKAK